jgi:hypothetical protein
MFGGLHCCFEGQSARFHLLGGFLASKICFFAIEIF